MTEDELRRKMTPIDKCDYCLELMIKIQRGELTGTVMSCHPLDEIAPEAIRKYIESTRVE
jgi:hypothetical protein